MTAPHFNLPPTLGTESERTAYENERVEAVLTALLRHCGGLASALERVRHEIRESGDRRHHVHLDGREVWRGSWDAIEGQPFPRWRERFADDSPIVTVIAP